MALTVEQLAKREGKITASFLPALMAGDEARIRDEWLRLLGDPDWTPPDFSNNWPVQFGNFIEQFAIDWHERRTQKELIMRGEVVNHPTRPYVCATLDAFRPFDNMVIDCKASGAWRPLDEIQAYYTPQLVVQRACVGAQRTALLVVHGSAEPVELEIEIDPDYERTVWERVDQFWQCVQDMRPPVAFPTVTPPEQWRAVNLNIESAESQANWATAIKPHLVAWDTHQEAAKLFEEAKGEIKILMPEDCRKVTLGDVVVTRARNRAVTIKRVKG
jgi:predicted phage-related endonuclease